MPVYVVVPTEFQLKSSHKLHVPFYMAGVLDHHVRNEHFAEF